MVKLLLTNWNVAKMIDNSYLTQHVSLVLILLKIKTTFPMNPLNFVYLFLPSIFDR